MENTKGKLPVYRITVKGVLDKRWADRFPGLRMASEDGRAGTTTILTGALDQSALHGVLTIIRDLNLRLISIVECEDNREI